jgi:microsomal dipeptidase-like Zn-dependent dipeptidase
MKLHHLLALALLAAPSQAGSCGSAAKVVRDVFLKFDAEVAANCKAGSPGDCAVGLFSGLVKSLGRWFDAGVSKNQWATIGPRRLTFARQNGTLAGTSGRLFLTAVPMIDGEVTLTLKKTGGKGKASVTICKYPRKGGPVTLKDVVIPPGKDNVGKTWTWKLRGVKDHVLAVKLDGKSVAKKFEYQLHMKLPERAAAPVVRNALGPVKGQADLHLHLGGHLAHCEGWVWGDPSKKLEDCDGKSHGVMFGPIVGLIAKGAVGTMAGGPHPKKTRARVDWPRFDDVIHQQSHHRMLKQALNKGLKLVVASAMNFQGMCEVVGRNKKPGAPPQDMEAVRRQLNLFHEMDKKFDWFEVVTDPWQARKVIHEGKLAVVLSLEVSNLMPPSDGNWKDQLKELQSRGVRSMQVAHETDSEFAGCAFHESVFWFFRKLKGGETVDVGGAGVADNRNATGLKAKGRQLLDAMVARKMLVDVSHLSQKAIREAYQHLATEHTYYPIYNSHTRFAPGADTKGKDASRSKLLTEKDRATLKGFVTFPRALEWYRKSGGMIGLRTGLNKMRTYDPKIPNDCDGSAKSLAQQYRYGQDKGVSMGWGSDFNGNITQLAPRYGEKACWSAKKYSGAKHGVDQADRAAQVAGQTGKMLGSDFDVKGLEHIGYLPDVAADWRSYGVDTGIVDNSAEAFLKMWERAHGPRKGPLGEAEYRAGWLGASKKASATGVRRPSTPGKTLTRPKSGSMTRPKRSGTMTRPR